MITGIQVGSRKHLCISTCEHEEQPSIKYDISPLLLLTHLFTCAIRQTRNSRVQRHLSFHAIVKILLTVIFLESGQMGLLQQALFHPRSLIIASAHRLCQTTWHLPRQIKVGGENPTSDKSVEPLLIAGL